MESWNRQRLMNASNISQQSNPKIFRAPPTVTVRRLWFDFNKVLTTLSTHNEAKNCSDLIVCFIT